MMRKKTWWYIYISIVSRPPIRLVKMLRTKKICLKKNFAFTFAEKNLIQCHYLKLPELRIRTKAGNRHFKLQINKNCKKRIATTLVAAEKLLRYVFFYPSGGFLAWKGKRQQCRWDVQAFYFEEVKWGVKRFQGVM